MKKYILFILIAFILLLNTINLTNVTATNDIKYGRAITQDVGFYKDSNGIDLAFYIPYTYYVKILEEGQPYSHVEIYGGNSDVTPIDGYALTSELYFEDETPLFPYPSIILTTKCTCAFASTKNLDIIKTYMFENNPLKYYGHAFDNLGNYIYFVEYNKTLGYVSESSIQHFNFILHPTPLPKTETSTDNPINTTNHNKDITETIKLIIIICVVLAGIIILAVIFKPSVKNDNRNYYDENDYE